LLNFYLICEIGSTLHKNFSLPEIKTSMRENEDGGGIQSLKGYPSKRQVSLNPENKSILKNGNTKKSVVGSIKDRIQKAIKQSQNDRYNRDALDDLGGMEFKIAKSNVKENKIEKQNLDEEKEDLGRLDQNYKVSQTEEGHQLNGDYKIEIK
jgi:hypothetical protein